MDLDVSSLIEFTSLRCFRVAVVGEPIRPFDLDAEFIYLRARFGEIIHKDREGVTCSAIQRGGSGEDPAQAVSRDRDGRNALTVKVIRERLVLILQMAGVEGCAALRLRLYYEAEVTEALVNAAPARDLAGCGANLQRTATSISRTSPVNLIACELGHDVIEAGEEVSLEKRIEL